MDRKDDAENVTLLFETTRSFDSDLPVRLKSESEIARLDDFPSWRTPLVEIIAKWPLVATNESELELGPPNTAVDDADDRITLLDDADRMKAGLH